MTTINRAQKEKALRGTNPLASFFIVITDILSYMRNVSMKRMGILFALVAMLLPMFSHAATIAELQAQLQVLMAQLATLQSQSTTSAAPQSGAASCPNLTRNFLRGSRGTDVTQLQQFLIFQNFLAADSATGFFGAMTEAAVKQFQCSKMSICSGSSISNGYGAVGPKTRDKIAMQCKVTTSVPKTSADICAIAKVQTTCLAGEYVTGYGECGGVICTPITQQPATTATCTLQSQQTQTLSCPTGQTGSITQSRTSSCPGPTWSAWQTTSNTCTVGVVVPQTYYSGNWADAFDTALAEAASSGKKFFLKNGTYALNRKILIPNNVTIAGESRDGTIITFSGGDSPYLAAGSNNTIQDITMDCAHMPQSSGILAHGLENDYRHDIKIRNVHVKNCAYQGISLQYARAVTLDSVETDNNGSRGLNVSAFSHDNFFTNMSAHDNTNSEVIFGHGSYNNTLQHSDLFNSNNGGLWIVAGAHNNVVNDVTISSPKVGPWIYGVVFWDTYGNTLNNVRINGFKHGILVRGGDYDSPYAGVLDDTRDNEFTAIFITGDASPEAIAIELSVLAKAANSIRQYTVFNNTFADMTIISVAHTATAVSETGVISDIRNNMFKNIQTTAPYNFGVYSSQSIQ